MSMKDVWERVEDLEVLVDSLHEQADLLDELIPILLEYNRLRDDEWDFEESHGNRDMWDDATVTKHDELINDIALRREKIRNILQKATGDQKLQF